MRDYNFYRGEYSPKATEAVTYLHPEQIKWQKNAKTPDQNHNAIIRLAESIKKYGILEPLAVKSTGESNGYALYDLISGERRLRAAILLGLDKIPCQILPESHRTCTISGILEQIASKNLHFFEQASAFRMLMEEFSLTQEEIARKCSLSQSAVANKLRLLHLSKEEQAEILQAKLTERHARALLRLKTQDLRQRALHQILSNRLNVAATEALVDEMSAKTPPAKQENAAFSVVFGPQKPPSGITPRKFALQDLTPLYNSIERTLSIFRKTGATVTSAREESPEGVRIIIHIPKRA